MPQGKSRARIAPRGERARPARPPARPCEAGAGLRDAWVALPCAAHSAVRLRFYSCAVANPVMLTERRGAGGWAEQYALSPRSQSARSAGGAAACARSLRGKRRARAVPPAPPSAPYALAQPNPTPGQKRLTASGPPPFFSMRCFYAAKLGGVPQGMSRARIAPRGEGAWPPRHRPCGRTLPHLACSGPRPPLLPSFPFSVMPGGCVPCALLPAASYLWPAGSGRAGSGRGGNQTGRIGPPPAFFFSGFQKACSPTPVVRPVRRG